jgi:hypothetical protein
MKYIILVLLFLFMAVYINAIVYISFITKFNSSDYLLSIILIAFAITAFTKIK